MEEVHDPDTEISQTEAAGYSPNVEIGQQIYWTINIAIDQMPLFSEYLGNQAYVKMQNLSLTKAEETT